MVATLCSASATAVPSGADNTPLAVVAAAPRVVPDRASRNAERSDLVLESEAAAAQAVAQRGAQQQARREQAAAKAAAGTQVSVSAIPVQPPGGDPAANRELGHYLVLEHGWDESEFGCVDRIWTQESGWRTNAENASSGAYGIPQALPASKLANAGDDWRTNPATQITWGLGYIEDTYGTPCGAWAFKSAHGWY